MGLNERLTYLIKAVEAAIKKWPFIHDPRNLLTLPAQTGLFYMSYFTVEQTEGLLYNQSEAT